MISILSGVISNDLIGGELTEIFNDDYCRAIRYAAYANSRLYLSFCAFISAMNWMNSGACLMRFK